MYSCVEEPEYQEKKYLDVNSLYPYVMSEIDFPVGHPEIRHHHHSCKNLMSKLEMRGEKFLGLCQVKILPPDKLFVPCLAHQLENKLSFCLCRTCASNGKIQRKASNHDREQRSWIDVYTSIDMERALSVGYEILEHKEIWHYHSRGKKLFREFILNIVKRKIECPGFPPTCTTDDAKLDYVKSLREQCSIDLNVENI